MRVGLIPVIAGLMAPFSASAVEAPGVEACAATEERALCHVVVVPAPVSEVWRLWTTSEGLSSWVAPVAAIDLRVGGAWEASYDRSARVGDPGNIRNRIVALSHERLLAIEIADAPPNFPHEELARLLATAIEFEPIDRLRTRVRVTMTGYREGPGFDVLRRHFDRGNAWTLAKLHERIVSGPINWNTAPAP
jgi:uncharacterized protein YndB with AHSA1/START domain